MSEKEYLDADYEVIGMVNKGHGPGGELPSKAIHFIPEERADRVCALDERIQALREKMPLIATGMVLLSFLIGLAV